MKQFFTIDEDEIIIREELVSEMLYQLYCYTAERILHDDRTNALAMAEMYTRTEKNVIDVYRAQNLEREANSPTLWEMFHKKFPPEENNNPDTSSRDGFDDIISNGDVPF